MALMLAASAVQAAYVFEYVKTLPLTLGPEGVARPEAVSVDRPTDEICVTDARQSVFHLLTASGVPTFRTSHLAGLSHPGDGAVDAQGRIVFLDSAPDGGRTIRRLNAFGEPEPYSAEPPGPDWRPAHLIITRDGGYVTADAVTGVLAKHDPVSGKLLWQHRYAGEDGAEVNLGRPAEATDGSLYVPGGDLRRVLVLDAQGGLLESFGRFGSAPGRFTLPVAVAFGPEGEVLVLDRMRHKLMIFDQQNEFVTEFGTMGYAPGTFYHPLALAATADGLVYVAQGFRGRVQAFRLARQ